MVGWVGSLALSEALADAPCGCDLIEQADAMADERGAKVLRADGELHRRAWRCPRGGGDVDDAPLDDEHLAALVRVRRVTGCDADDLRACPGLCVRSPEAHEVVKLVRWQKAGQLHLRMAHPSGAVIDAIDEALNSIGARERDELERLKAKTDATKGGDRGRV